jgi:hypothetical protein
MSRCLLGVLVVAAGLVALTSTARETRSSVRKPASTDGNRLRETASVTVAGAPCTLFRPAPRFNLSFSLN